MWAGEYPGERRSPCVVKSAKHAGILGTGRGKGEKSGNR
jgi:hypothetical protein